MSTLVVCSDFNAGNSTNAIIPMLATMLWQQCHDTDIGNNMVIPMLAVSPCLMTPSPAVMLWCHLQCTMVILATTLWCQHRQQYCDADAGDGAVTWCRQQHCDFGGSSDTGTADNDMVYMAKLWHLFWQWYQYYIGHCDLFPLRPYLTL